MNKTAKMPVLFLGHGSPMNAIEENEFVTGFRNNAKEIPKPCLLHTYDAAEDPSLVYFGARRISVNKKQTLMISY